MVPDPIPLPNAEPIPLLDGPVEDEGNSGPIPLPDGGVADVADHAAARPA